MFNVVFRQSPSTLAEEKSYNPFLRTKVTSFLETLQIPLDQESFTDETRAVALKEIRRRKDAFSYKL